MMTNEERKAATAANAKQAEAEKAGAVSISTPEVAKIDHLESVPLAQLLARVQQLADEGYRLVTMTCNDIGGAFEVLYHFDRDLAMRHLSVTLPADAKLPSISGIYLCAFLVENEIVDLFGLQVDGLALDYKGRLVLTADANQRPLLKQREAGG